MPSHLRPMLLGTLLALLSSLFLVSLTSAHAQSTRPCTPTIKVTTDTFTIGPLSSPTTITVALDPCTLSALLHQEPVSIQSDTTTPDWLLPILTFIVQTHRTTLWNASRSCPAGISFDVITPSALSWGASPAPFYTAVEAVFPPTQCLSQ